MEVLKEWEIVPITMKVVSTGRYKGVVKLIIQWPSHEHLHYAIGLGDYLDVEFTRQAALHAMGIEYKPEVEEPKENSP